VRFRVSCSPQCPISEGIDLGFRVGTLKDSALVVRKILTHQHQLLASPVYLKKCKPSVVTPKPANGGQGKTGQREEAGD